MSRVQRSVAWVAVVVAVILLAGGPWPAPGQTKPGPRKLDLAHIIAPPESGAIGFKYLADEVTRRSNGQLNVVFHSGTLLSKDLEIMDAVKSGNGQGDPRGEGHEGERRRRGDVPQAGRGQDLAAVQAAVRRDLAPHRQREVANESRSRV